MVNILIFLLFAFFSAEANPLGPEGGIDGRIINGAVVQNASENPWMVGLRIKAFNTREIIACGGVLVHPRFVLTAAHCIPQGYYAEVSVGSLRRENFIPVAKMFFRNLTQSPKYTQEDIALLKLLNPVKISEKVAPILMHPGVIPPNESVKATGWGFTKNGGTVSEKLMGVDLNTISNEECQFSYPTLKLQAEHLCTDGKSKRGICNGDSGGPLTKVIGKVRKLVGLSAFVNENGKCGSGRPDGFTRISSYYDWVIRTINNNLN